MSFGNGIDAGYTASGEIARLEKLIADLRRIIDGKAPALEDLASAPLLMDFGVTYRPAPCLRGDVIGHPRLGNRNVFTTELWAYSPRDHWARTYSRFYRLGTPRDQQVPL